MMPRSKVITLGTYIRNLPWSIFNYIANELDAPGSCTNWKDFVMKIPISSTNPQPRFTMNEIRKFETLSMRGESPTIAIIDAWGTYNCTVEDLLAVLQSLNLHNSAQKVRQLISTLPRYEEVAISANDPPSYRQSVENTSIYRQQSTSNHSHLMAALSINSDENKQVNVRCFPYSDLLELTYSFDDKLKLGEGAFGSVFKGHINSPNKLPDAEGTESSKTVAIKRLKLESSETSNAIIEQFKKEIHVISELKHQNILPLLGYSCDGPELCLIYEYMFNDSLSFNLSQCRIGKTHMSDSQRVEILLGSSKGINYLHERNIIHRDVKTSNILLDSEMIPRISDFGLIRSLGGSNKDRLSTQTTNPIGTLVYMAPEAYLGTITYAMDVYSFGVVILEMLSGMEVMDDTREPNHLALYVEDLIEDDKRSQVFDASAGSWQGVGDDLLQISTDCLERKFKKRPKITEGCFCVVVAFLFNSSSCFGCSFFPPSCPDSEMSDITVAKNGQATLTCEMPDDSYKGEWIQNGTTLVDGDRITVSQQGAEHTLVLKTTLKSDEGIIKFKSDKGGFELDFNLIVTEPPSVDPAEFEECGKSLGAISIGSPATLKVPYSGQTPITVTWCFNGAEIHSDDHYTITSTDTLTTLVVGNFQNEDCGNFEVTLHNDFGTLKIPVDVSLSETSQVNYEVVQVPGETIEKTTTVNMTATEAPSKPAGNIKFNSMSENKFSIGLMTTSTPSDVLNYLMEMKDEAGSVWHRCALFTPEEAKAVSVKGVKAGQRMTFRIKAINEIGESEPLESRAVTVQKAADPPKLDADALAKIGNEIRLKAGKDLRLKLPFKASPMPIAAWVKNGKKLAIKGRYQSDTNEKETTFQISALNGEDSGEYQLNLKNKEGVSSHTFKLIVVDVPGQPQGPMEITDISGSEMTLNWQAPRHDGGKPILQYIVDKKEEKATKWAEVAKIEGAQLSYTVPQLVKGGKYCFRVRAVNEEGESKALTSVATVASGPPGAPSVPVAIDVTSKKMIFTWTAPENDGGNEITGYSVEYRENGGDWMMVTKDHIEGLKATLNDLHDESVYELRVAGKNSAGKGKYCESKPTAAVDKPEPPVLDDKIKAQYSEPVCLNAGEDLVLKLPITGIPRPKGTWTYGKEEIKDQRASNSSEKGFVLFTLEELKRSDSGTYNIVAENSEGKETMSVALRVLDVPTCVENLKVFKASSKSLTIGWQPPKDDGESTITAYSIEVQCCEDEAHEWIKLNKVFPGEELKATYEVKKGNSYKFRVCVLNMLGSSPPVTSDAILADDKFKPPAAPAAPVVSELTKSTCVLNWTAPEDNGSPINGYLVETKRVGRRNWVKEYNGRLVEETKCLVKDLHKGCEYVFRIIADNEAGFGAPGAESEVTIPMDPIPPAPTPTDFVIEDMSDNAITFTWKDGEGLERDKLHGYIIQKLPEGAVKWVNCNNVPIRSNRAFITDFRTGEKFRFRISPMNDGGLGGFCELPDLIEVRQMQNLPVIELRGEALDTVHVSAGGTLRLSAFVSGKPNPVIRWMKDKVDQERRGATRNQDGIAHLNVRYLTKEDTGTFTISATNKSGKVKKDIKVIVHDAPDPPCNITMGDINPDGSIMLSFDPPACDGGSPIKHYCVQMSDAYLKFQTVQDKLTVNKCLVKDLRPGATYYFRIYAENEHGRGEYAQSNLLTVIQKNEPVYIQRPKFNRMDTSKPAGFSLMLKNVQIKERRSAKFTCATVGRPEPEITWFKDNNKIKANNKYSMKNSMGVCSLLISNCRARDCGKYRCEAKNPTGEAMCEATLMVYPDH